MVNLKGFTLNITLQQCCVWDTNFDIKVQSIDCLSVFTSLMGEKASASLFISVHFNQDRLIRRQRQVLECNDVYCAQDSFGA